MKAALFYYDGFAQFEIALALLKLDALEWHHIALEKRPYKSLEGQTFLVQGTLETINPNTIDLMVIPGGDSSPLFHVEALKTFIEACLSSGGIVAGICGGSELLAGFGLLDGLCCTGGATGISSDDPLAKYYAASKYEDQPILIDDYKAGIIITAQGQSYEAFANKLVEVINERTTHRRTPSKSV